MKASRKRQEYKKALKRVRTAENREARRVAQRLLGDTYYEIWYKPIPSLYNDGTYCDYLGIKR